MERFMETIKVSMREMGAQFVKAVADLHQQEGVSKADMEDE
jgi:hypothetical protein